MTPGKVFSFIVLIIVLGIVGQYGYFFVQVYLLLLGLIFLAVTTTYFVKYHTLWPALIRARHAQMEKIHLEPVPEFNDQWKTIRAAMHSNDLNELRVAMIDADTLMEDLLRKQGVQGDTMAALIAEATLRGVIGTAAVSRFHRMRNRIVHESTFSPSKEELRSQLQAVDKVLVHWGAVVPG